jgi:hypothetical protein
VGKAAAAGIQSAGTIAEVPLVVEVGLAAVAEVTAVGTRKDLELVDRVGRSPSVMVGAIADAAVAVAAARKHSLEVVVWVARTQVELLVEVAGQMDVLSSTVAAPLAAAVEVEAALSVAAGR